MWEGINRRKFPRANYKCIIVIKSMGEKPKTITTHTENVGLGGICVILEEAFNLFEDVELELLLEEGHPPIKCAGSIVWVVKKSDPGNKKKAAYDTGIEFASLKESDKKTIGEIVEKILSSSS